MKHKPRPLIPIRPEGLEEQARRLLEQEPPEDATGVNVADSGDFWRVEGVQYRNGIYTVDLAKALLEQGRTKTQDEWAEFSKQAKQNNRFYTPDMPLAHATFKALYNLKASSETEEIRNFLRSNMRSQGFSTLTRIKYQPNGLDEVVHDYKQNNQRVINCSIVGADGKVTTVDRSVLQAVLEDDNPQEVDAVYRWINDTDVYFWRVNNRPENSIERVAWLVADSVGCDLSCSGDPGDRNASLGVRAVRRSRKNFLDM